MQKIKGIILIIVMFFGMFPFTSATQAETLEEQLARLQREIAEIQNQKNNLQNQINSNNYTISGYSSEVSKLYAEAQIYQKEIDELNLQIKELEVSINILDEDIKQTEEEILEKERYVAELELESNTRIKNSYYNFRIYGSIEGTGSLPFLNNINSYFKDSQYKEIIQSDTNSIITQLINLREQLREEKKLLAGKLEEVKKDKELIVIKQDDVSKKKEDLDAKMAIYYQQINYLNAQNSNAQNSISVFSQEEAEKRRTANAIQLTIANSFSSISGGTYVVAGTLIGLQGCTGLCTGPHLHFMVYVNGSLVDPCSQLSGGVCGYGSGGVQWPLNPVSYYTSGYGNRCFNWGGSLYCDFHNGIDIVGSYATAPIYAAHNGYLFKGTDTYGAKYIIICQNQNCNQGYKTGYWHLSSF